MPFISIWMELENTILSEMSKKKKTTKYHLSGESKK